MVPSSLDISSCKVGELNLMLVTLVPLVHLLRHEKSISDGIADETVRLLSLLVYEASQNSTGMGVKGEKTKLIFFRIVLTTTTEDSFSLS